MKHCPNLTCPFIDQTGFISEFRDEVTVCPDCETVLVDGPAPPVPERPALGTESLTWQPDDVVWNVASYGQEDEALADLDTLAEEGIESVVKSEELPDEDGNLAQLYHLQVMPIDRFVAQTALGLDDGESQVDEEYWDDLQESGHFGSTEGADEDPMWDVRDDLDDIPFDDEVEERESGISPLVTFVVIIVIIALILSMTRMYRLF